MTSVPARLVSVSSGDEPLRAVAVAPDRRRLAVRSRSRGFPRGDRQARWL